MRTNILLGVLFAVIIGGVVVLASSTEAANKGTYTLETGTGYQDEGDALLRNGDWINVHCAASPTPATMSRTVVNTREWEVLCEASNADEDHLSVFCRNGGAVLTRTIITSLHWYIRCGNAPLPTATPSGPTNTPTNTNTPTATPTSTNTPGPTSTPTDTPTPGPTNTP